MNALTVFEERKQEFRDMLLAAGTADERVAAAEMIIDQVACVLAQQEQDALMRQRQQAVLAVARRSPSLLEAAQAKGELVIAPAREGRRKKDEPVVIGIPVLRHLPLLKGIPLIKTVKMSAKTAGAAILAILAMYELIDGHLFFAILQLAGGALVAAGDGAIGSLMGRLGSAQARGVVEIQEDTLLRRIGDICRAADVCVSDLMLIEKEAGLARLSGTADEATLDLLASMLEAKASGRQEAASRALDQAEQYLRMLGVEVVYYSEEQAHLFDVLPTLSGERTIRPALMKEDKLLRRGMAVRQMEGSVGA